jgi:hypothetical protein
MGMSISSSRASTAMLSQPINTQATAASSAANLVNELQRVKPTAQQPQLNTEGLVGTLINMLA